MGFFGSILEWQTFITYHGVPDNLVLQAVESPFYSLYAIMEISMSAPGVSSIPTVALAGKFFRKYVA
jgi:hypothetical protein